MKLWDVLDPATSVLQALVTACLAVVSFTGTAWKKGRRSNERRLTWHAGLVALLVAASLALQLYKQHRTTVKDDTNTRAAEDARAESRASADRLLQAQQSSSQREQQLLSEIGAEKVIAAEANGRLAVLGLRLANSNRT